MKKFSAAALGTWLLALSLTGCHLIVEFDDSRIGADAAVDSGTPPRDMAVARDMEVEEDLGSEEDLGVESDMTVPLDMAPPLDMTVALDMTPPLDMALDMGPTPCPSGFTGTVESGCVDINECDTAPCDVGDRCTNTDGSFTCTACPAGFTSDGSAAACTDIDECDEGLDECDLLVSCTNTDGSYTCGDCPDGYSGGGLTGCMDRDECMEGACSELVSCDNTPGSFECGECPSGYEGDGTTCTDIDECDVESDDCDALVTCTNVDGSFECGDCPVGYADVSGACVPVWTNDAYIKASNAEGGDLFGAAVALSADGNRLAVGAYNEGSDAIGVGGDETNNAGVDPGAVYVFVKSGASWVQEAYIKASNTAPNNNFGTRLAFSADGSRLAVSDNFEDSAAVGVDGDGTNTAAQNSGAVYVFVRTGSSWEQEAYIKASNTDINDQFGLALSLSADGDWLAVGAPLEDSDANVVDGDDSDDSAQGAGAVYMFARSGSSWTQQAYIKAENAGAGAGFGWSVSLSADATRVGIGARGESSAATGVGGDAMDTSAPSAGAAYVFVRTGSTWSQEAYIKASNTGENDDFGVTVSLSADGMVFAVAAHEEDSSATGINGDETNNTGNESGAVYVFSRSGSAWSQEAYIKASNADVNDQFGLALTLSADGARLAVGCYVEASAATGVGGDESDDSAPNAGAVYVFSRSGSAWSQEAYIKAPNARSDSYFGVAVSLSSNGRLLAVGAYGESSNATGIGGDPTNTDAPFAGAAYTLFMGE